MEVDKVYKTQLLRRYSHLGLPIRNARPKQVGNAVREVLIGDVGWQSRRDSAFHVLFNAIDPTLHPDLLPPAGYRAFPINPSRTPEKWDMLHSHTIAALPPVPVQSRSITQVELNGSLSTMTPSSASSTIKVSCSKDKGAVLIMHHPADHEHLEPCQEVEDYVLMNFESWYAHASSRGLSPGMGELIFVTETYKTSRWDTFTFTGRGYEVQLSLQGSAPVLASASLRLNVSSTTLSGVHQLYGPANSTPLPNTTVSGPDSSSALPVRPSSDGEAGGASDFLHDTEAERLPRNQCIFLQGYVPAKRTFLAPYVMKAAAEPVDLGGPPPDEGHDMVPSETAPYVQMLVESPPAYDPLLSTLQHILESDSTTECAIAHHRVLSTLFFNEADHDELDTVNDMDLEGDLQLHRLSVSTRNLTTIIGEIRVGTISSTMSDTIWNPKPAALTVLDEVDLLMTRFNPAVDPGLLDETLKFARELLSLSPEGHPDRARACDNLAISLKARFDHTGDILLLEEAVELQREALRLRPEGHPERARSCGNLANLLKSCFDHTGDDSLWQETLELEREALHLQQDRRTSKRTGTAPPVALDDRLAKFVVGTSYQLLDVIGEGAYGTVCSAIHLPSQRKVAVKRITPFDHSMFCLRTLREIRLLLHFNHENIISILDVLRPKNLADFEAVYLVQELMETDLHRVIRTQELSDDHCQYFIYQTLRAIKALHSADVLHRDLKPSNLLVNANCDLKLCDFGLARSAKPSPHMANDSSTFLTEYVATRWYRAPEVMLTFKEYTRAIDMWSVGCVLAEMLSGQPLFPGRDYHHQLSIILDILGTPTLDDFYAITSNRSREYIRALPFRKKKSFASLYPKASPQAVDLLERLLTFSPQRRITVDDALAHPYLEAYHDPQDEPTAEPLDASFFDFENEQLTKEDLKQLIYEEIMNPHQTLRA